MSTPERKSKKVVSSSTPKLGRGTQPVDSSFDSSALHQSGSKAVQKRVVGLNEQIVKRKTELAELLRSTGKKRVKKNEPGDEASIEGLQQGFPDIDSGTDAPDEAEGVDDPAKFAVKGSLLNDSSFMESPISGDTGAAIFSPAGGFTDASNYFGNGDEFITGTAHELHMEQEQLEEIERGEDERADEQEETDPHHAEGQYASSTPLEEEEPVLDQSRISAFDTVLEYVGDGPSSSGADAFESNRVAKTLVFPDMQKPNGAPKVAPNATNNNNVNNPHIAPGNSIFTPVAKRVLLVGGDAPIHTVFLTGSGGEGSEQPAARRTSPLASSSAEHKSSGPSFSAANSTHKNTSTGTGTGPNGPEEMDLSMSALYPENQSLVNFSSSGPVHILHANASFTSASSANALGYRDSLLHQLKVTTAKNEMLQGKLRDIEELVDRNYGSISERSKLLTAERNKLERQRTLLDDELVATKEELLFIRAQLQNKSARISELETELLEAQRMLVDPGTGTETDSEGGGNTDDQYESPEKTEKAEKKKDRGVLSPDASAGSMYLTRSPAEIMALEEQKEESAREIELLNGLLVEQEQQLIEAELNKTKLAELQQTYQTTLDENFQLAAYLEAAEKKSEELDGRVVELEEQVKAAEELAFEFEARAAALEMEMFKKMDEEHARAIEKAREAEKAAASPPVTKQNSSSPKAQSSQGDVNTLVYNSSPSLPLLLHPTSPPRIPREGYAVLLIVIALLQAAVWALVLFAGLLYLGVLEARFGLDIVRDGGVYDQLFLLKGVSAIAGSVFEGLDLSSADLSLASLSHELSQGLQYSAAVSQDFVAGLAASAQELFEQGLQLIR